MNTSQAEPYRARHPLNLPQKEGDQYGWFEIPSPTFPTQDQHTLFVMAAPPDGEWQHISVSKRRKPPTWAEMCYIKDLFFDENEVVVQFHPAKKDYVNFAKNCLHLWKWNAGEFPVPDPVLVGPK